MIISLLLSKVNRTAFIVNVYVRQFSDLLLLNNVDGNKVNVKEAKKGQWLEMVDRLYGTPEKKNANNKDVVQKEVSLIPLAFFQKYWISSSSFHMFHCHLDTFERKLRFKSILK